MGRRLSGTTSVSLLFVVLACCPLPSTRGEMRKSWQAKSVDVQAQLLKAARLEDPPNAKPPEPSELETRSAVQEAATGQTGPMLSPTDSVRVAEELKVKPAPVFSSRVRTRYGTVVGSPAVPDKAVEAVEVVTTPAPQADDEGRVAGEGRDEATDELAGSGAKKPTERVKQYTFPPVLNMTIDEPNNIVKVKLNQDIVRDMLNTGREAGGGIGGKKMLRYVLPLFILPFLIQSAVIPFMLTAVKLFLLKSLMAGKLAIFLLLLGAFKNFTKKDRDVYVKDLPDRRYEPSSEGFAYLAEGRPSGWVN
uniref:Protein osiris 22 n=1 Tax=Anopheles merus TaxID=30066 RepID=A0A182VIQ6_ANOME